MKRLFGVMVVSAVLMASALAMAAQTLTLKMPLDMADHVIQVTLPDTWQIAGKTSGSSLKLELKEQTSPWPTFFELEAGCNGVCAADRMPANGKKYLDSRRAFLARTFINSGDPKKDALKAEVTVLDKGIFGGVHFEVIQSKLSDELKQMSGELKEWVSVSCYLHKLDRESIVMGSTRVEVGMKDKILPSALEICKSLRY